MSHFKDLSRAEAIEMLLNDEEVYALRKIDKYTYISDLKDYVAFGVVQDNAVADKEIEQAVDRTVPETPEKPKTRIDAGKLGALYRAGWEPKKIAEDLGCSTQTVRNYIAKLDNGEI